MLVLTGCGVYKIEQRPLTDEERGALPAVPVNTGATVSVVQQGDSECVASSFFIVTLGLFPLHCTDTWYAVYEDADKPGQLAWDYTFTVSTLQGWWYLWFMPMSPNWHYGYSSHAKKKMELELNAP